MSRTAQKETTCPSHDQTTNGSLTELLQEAMQQRYDLRPLLYCLNYRTNPEQFCESLRIVYMELTEYLLRYPGYSTTPDMAHCLHHIRCLYEVFLETRNDPSEL